MHFAQTADKKIFKIFNLQYKSSKSSHRKSTKYVIFLQDSNDRDLTNSGLIDQWTNTKLNGNNFNNRNFFFFLKVQHFGKYAYMLSF